MKVFRSFVKISIPVEVIERAQYGDPVALQGVYDDLSGVINYYLYRVPEDRKGDFNAEVQEHILNALSKFDPQRGASFRTFMSLIVKYVYIDWYKKYNKDIELERLPRENDDDSEKVLKLHEKYSLEGMELIEKLKSELSERDQEMIDLYLEGYNYVEIADKLKEEGYDIGSEGVRMSFKKRFRKILEELQAV